MCGFLFGKRMYIIIYSTIRNVGRFGRSSLLEFGKKRGPLECRNFGRGPKPQETAGESESRRGPLRWPTLRSPLSLKIWETGESRLSRVHGLVLVSGRNPRSRGAEPLTKTPIGCGKITVWPDPVIVFFLCIYFSIHPKFL